jgi:NAD-dependent deacetylase
VSVAALAELIRANQPCVVLTGAGVSTESGIPDFRSPTGIWARDCVGDTIDPVPDAVSNPMEVATIEAFRRDPARVWEFYARRLGVVGEVEPNAGHRAIAELERRGLVRGVVTQNVDGLHQRAGSRDVIEVHGSLRQAVCPACGAGEPIEGVLRQLAGSPVPACPACGDVLKPGVVMFGEFLPPAAIERATELARSAGLVLVVGSSLEVWPVAGLPLEARAFAIVNRGPSALDRHAALTIDAGAGDTLAALLAQPCLSGAETLQP